MLKFCIREIRAVLGDKPQAPRFIETLHRRGYRFIGPVVSSQHSGVSSQNEENQKAKGKSQKAKVELHSPAPNPQHPAPTLVGRDAELAQLHNWLDKASNGERQIIFVTGEPGIGKTTLVETFLFGVRSLESQEENQKSKGKSQKAKIENLAPSTQHLTPSPWLGCGQCIEHYGAGEAYLPIFSALGRLCREPGGQHLIDLLQQHAPTWLVQMPALLSVTELEVLQRKTQGATRERMLRELTEAVETLTAERPLVLWLEDLHWCDYATLDLISFLARRSEQARLLVIGAYRPVEVLAGDHPLHVVKQELQLHGQCEELVLGLLPEVEVGKYLAMKFPVEARYVVPLQQLTREVHHRTEGNPLFMVNMVDYLLAQGALVRREGQWIVRRVAGAIEAGVPQNLQRMIEKQIDRLSLEEQRLLEAASIVGVEFSAVAVAAALGIGAEQVEECCEGLARRYFFLSPTGSAVWPDGTLAAYYGFLHALYQNVLYERVTMTRRQRLHQRIGEREENGYGEQAREIAGELAAHFARSRDYRRAVKYFGQAGAKAIGRSAHREAIGHLTKAIELLSTLPDTPERTQQEITLQVALGPALIATKGFAAPEVERAYARAQELCQQAGEAPRLFPVLVGLFRFYLLRAELRTAHELGQQCLSLAQSVQESALLLEAYMALGPPLLFLGKIASAREHTERGIALYDPQQHRSHALLYQLDPGVVCLAIAAWALWLLGYPDQACKRIHAALALAREISHPFSLALALLVAAVLRQLRQEEQAVNEGGEALMALSREQGFPHWLAWGAIVRGWALAEQGQAEEGIAQIHQGLTAYRATGAELFRPHHLTLLAEAYRKVGQAEEGLTALTEALAVADNTEERWYEAELYRLTGELTLQRATQKSKGKRQKAKIETNPQPLTPSTQAAVQEAEECFLKAIAIAQKQQAKSLELRATMSLARLWQQQGKTIEAHKLLAEIYAWFTEGFDTKDLQEARALLDSLGSRV